MASGLSDAPQVAKRRLSRPWAWSKSAKAVDLVPVDGELQVDIRGDLAGILGVCGASKNPSGLGARGV